MQMNGVLTVFFEKTHIHPLLPGGRNVFANEIRLDRQFPVPSVNQNRQLNTMRPSQIVKCVQSRARRATTEEDVIHDDHGLAIDVRR